MDMRMQTDVLSPGMKHTHCTAFDTKVCISKLPQSIPHRVEQLTVKPFAVEQTNIVQFVWKGENNVVMFYREGGFQ